MYGYQPLPYRPRFGQAVIALPGLASVLAPAAGRTLPIRWYWVA